MISDKVDKIMDIREELNFSNDEKQLIDFGNYLLQHKKNKETNSPYEVTHADIENWKESKKDSWMKPRHINIHGETELDAIRIAFEEYKRNYITLDEAVVNLYTTLFYYRDTAKETLIHVPARYSLVEVLEELKLGRPTPDQIFLKTMIDLYNRVESFGHKHTVFAVEFDKNEQNK